MTITRKMLPKLSTLASVGPSTLDPNTRTVQVVWSTGQPFVRSDGFGQFTEELDMSPQSVDLTRLQNGAPVLDSHQIDSLDKVIGRVESVRLENGRGIATLRFADDEISDRTFRKISSGILNSLSVGYTIQEFSDVTRKDDKIPRYRATRWTPLEISVVGAPADDSTHFRNKETPELFEVQITTGALDAQKETSMTPQEAALAERLRIRALKQVGRESNIDETTIERWIDDGTSADEAKARALKFQATQYDAQRAASIDNTVRVEVGTSNRTSKLERAAEALAFRINPSLKPKENSEFVGRSMVQILERSIVDRKLGMSNEQVVARAMSSSDFPLLLANVAEKVAAARYQLQPKSWSKIAATDTLRNFKTNNVVRGGDFPSLEERQEGAEFKRGSFGEEQEQVTLKEWGRVVSMTRRAIIGDDLGQLSLVANDAGVSAARLENKLVFNVLKDNALMSDGFALFSSEHANLGTGAAISDTSIGEAMKLMRQQMSVDGLDQLNLNPKYMIVGPESEALARRYLTQINPTQASNVNPWAGMLELIVDSEINSNDFYFAADPNMARGVVLYRLEGYESPRIETRVDFETESVQIKCAHDAAAAAIDYRPLVKNANAS